MKSASSCQFADLVPDYCSGRMADELASEFEIHLDDCESCLALLAERSPHSSDESWLDLLRSSNAPHVDVTGIKQSLDAATKHRNDAQVETPAASPAAELGPRYITTRRIGIGGSGEVWEARDVLLHRNVAIKLLRTTAATLHESQRLMVEAAALARLDHPHIVSLHEVESCDGQPALIMEFVQGPSLATWLRGVPRPTVAAQLLEQICQAVEHAHAKGVVHRDLKPSNILLKPAADPPFTADEQRPELGCWCPKIADFGLAKLIDKPNLTLSGQQIGTPAYMAPEQVLPDNSIPAIDPLVDIYGLGAVLYELLTGRPPFVSSDPALTMSMILREDPLAPRSLTPAIPRDLETICLKCLHKEPHRRYQSATQLRADLVAFLENRPISARPISVPRKVLNWCRRHPSESIAAIASSALLVALTLGSIWTAALQQQLRQDALSKATLATEMQLLEKQQKDAVIEKFEQVLQTHLQFLAMIDDPKSAEPGALQRIRGDSLIPAAEMALQYLELLHRGLQSGNQLSASEVSTALNSMTLIMQAGLNYDFENLFNDLQKFAPTVHADNGTPNPHRELQIRMHHVHATLLSRKDRHSEAGDAFCRMAELIEQQSQGPDIPAHILIERGTSKVCMLLNARGEYLLGKQPDRALDAVRQAAAGSQQLRQLDSQNINSTLLFLESQLFLAQMLPLEEAAPIAIEALAISSQTRWDSSNSAQRARAMQEQLRTLIR